MDDSQDTPVRFPKGIAATFFFCSIRQLSKMAVAQLILLALFFWAMSSRSRGRLDMSADPPPQKRSCPAGVVDAEGSDGSYIGNPSCANASDVFEGFASKEMLEHVDDGAFLRRLLHWVQAYLFVGTGWQTTSKTILL